MNDLPEKSNQIYVHLNTNQFSTPKLPEKEA
jgi:hypothetical protein